MNTLHLTAMQAAYCWLCIDVLFVIILPLNACCDKRRRDIRSLRDLRPEHLPLLHNIRDQGQKVPPLPPSIGRSWDQLRPCLRPHTHLVVTHPCVLNSHMIQVHPTAGLAT